MTTFRDILNENKSYILYLGFSILKHNRKRIRKLIKISYYRNDETNRTVSVYNVSLNADSFCMVDGNISESWEVYTNKNGVIDRMENAIRESLEKGGCSIAVIRKMVQAKWRKWLI